MQWRTMLFAAGTSLAAASAAAQSSLILDRDRPDRVQPLTTTPSGGQKPKASAPVIESGAAQAAATIRGIHFAGTKAPEPVARAAARFIGQPASGPVLQKIAAAISDAYAKADVALYSVLIPAQDLSTGTLNVVLIEGQVESIAIDNKSGKRARRLIAAIAAHMQGEVPLRRSTLQRYISLMQDVPGTRIDVQVLQGSRRGAVKLVVTITDKRPDIGFGFDNLTGSTYRHGEFTGTGKFYGIVRGGDETDISLAASANFKAYRYAAIAHNTPVGSIGDRLSLSFGYLETRPQNTVIEGNAKIAGITYSRPLIRDYKRNLTVSATLDGLNSDNAAFGQLIASERTRAVRLAAGYVEAQPKRTVSGGVTVSRGLDILGARVMAPFAETKFTKVNARAGLDQMLSKTLIARLRFSGQWTRDRLPAFERFAVGGQEFGRAYDVAAISADRGVAGSAELAIRPFSSKTWGATEIYGFGDKARVSILDRGPFPGGTYELASAGGGTRIAWTDKAALFLEAAKALDRPYPGYEKDWRFSVGWKLSLRP
jgi:hemolysin activation/secretion protein